MTGSLAQERKHVRNTVYQQPLILRAFTRDIWRVHAHLKSCHEHSRALNALMQGSCARQ